MTVERGYERQYGAPRPVGLPQAGAGAFGAGIGDGIAQVGGAMARAREADRIAAANQQAAASAVAMEQLKAETEDFERGMRDGTNPQAVPGGYGTADITTQFFRERFDKITEGVTDERVRQNLQVRGAAYLGDLAARTKGFEIGAAAKKLSADAGTYLDSGINRTVRGGDKTALPALMADYAVWVGGLEVPEQQKADLLQWGTKRIRSEVAAGWAADHPDWIKEFVADGSLDGIEPDDVRRIDAQADAAINVRQRQAEAEQAQREREAQAAERERQEAARDGIRTIEAKVRAGIVPTAGEIARADHGARVAKLDAHELVDLQAIGVRAAVNRRFAGQSGDALRRARAAFGSNSENDQIARGQFDDLIDKADSEDAARVKELMGQGPAGVVQALGTIGGSPERRYAVAEKLERGLGYVAGLDRAAQGWTLEGKELLKARPKEFGNDQQVRAAVDKALGPLKSFVGGQYDDVVANAWQLLAVGRNRKGAAGFDDADMAVAIKWATGASTRRDGTMQGGIGQVRRQPVILPDWQTAEEFDRTLSRADFTGAVYADKAPVRGGAEALRTTRPELAGEDEAGNPYYRFVDQAGRPLRRGNGDEFRLRLTRRR